MTGWPSNAAYVSAGLTMTSNVVGASPNNVAHVQLPVLHSSTSMQAVLRHRRLVEDNLLAGGLDVSHACQLTFAKDDSTSRDSRKASQPCISCMSSNFKDAAVQESKAVKVGSIGPWPLIAVKDMLGYDAESKPGPRERVEQTSTLQEVAAA